MNPIQVIYVLASVVLFYVLFARMKAYEARLTRLETRQPGKVEAKAVPVQPKQVWEKPVEPPQAGTVAANAIKPKIFLSQVPHKTVQLDNGGLEWECKI